MSRPERWGVHPGTELVVGDRGTILDPVHESRRLPWEQPTGRGSHYQQITYGGRKHGVSQLVWETHRPHEPIGDLDVTHVNGDREDNRVENLTLLNRSDNKLCTSNLSVNPSGFRGVGRARNGKFKAQKTVAYKYHHIGTYETPEEAARAHDDFAAGIEGMTPWGLNYPGRHFTRKEIVEQGMNPPAGGLALWRPVDYSNLAYKPKRAAGRRMPKVSLQGTREEIAVFSEPVGAYRCKVDIDWMDGLV